MAVWVFAAITKYVNIHAAYVGSVHARSHINTVMYMSTGHFCIAPDTIAYAKVSRADSIAWRTQLHLISASGSVLSSESLSTYAKLAQYCQNNRGAKLAESKSQSRNLVPRVCRVVTSLTALLPWYWIICIPKIIGYICKFK